MTQLTRDEINKLQLRLIYAIIVAGKSSNFAAQKLKIMFPMDTLLQTYRSPFDYLNTLVDYGELQDALIEAQVGNYNKHVKCFTQLCDMASDGLLDLRTCSAETLESIHGIGRKTARFFIIWTRPDARYAALDTHILKWLSRHQKNSPEGKLRYYCLEDPRKVLKKEFKIPRATPGSKKMYLELESAFLWHSDQIDRTPAELDRQIWEMASGKDWDSQFLDVI